MSEPTPSISERHLLTLCHSGDCCPRVYYRENSSFDSCLRVEDDHGNKVFFSPQELLQAQLVPVRTEPGIWALRDSFGNEAYITPEQLAVLHDTDNLVLIQDLLA